MQRRTCKSVSHPTTLGKGDGKAKRPFRKVPLADAVDFSSFCRLCATSHDPEEMSPLFEDPVSSISSKLSEIIRIQVTDGDGLPALICSSCFADLNFVHEFIEKSIAADRLLRKAILKACAAFDAFPPALVEVEVEESFDQTEITQEPISFDGQQMPVDHNPIEITDQPIAVDGEPTSFDGKPIKFQRPNAEDYIGDHTYSQSSDLPLNRAVLRKIHIKDGQSLTVVKLGEHCETKRGHINFVDGSTGRTTRVPLECCVLTPREINRAHSRLESEPPAFVAPAKSVACGPMAKNLTKPKPITGNANAHQAKKPNPPKASVCEICGKRFWRRAILRDHMHIHTGERPYVCVTCGKGYMIRTHLNMHVRVKHSDEVLPWFDCEICGYRAPAPSGLRMHMRVHTNSRPFMCPVCGKGFKQGSHLKSHIPTHGTHKPHICAVCGKQFKVKRQCAAHEAAHAHKRPPPERKFQCHLCGKAYGYNNLLVSHVARHEGVTRDFECAHCSKRFVDRNSVKRHIVLVHSGERPYSCAICGQAFKVAPYLKKHMLRMHDNDCSAGTHTNPEEVIPVRPT